MGKKKNKNIENVKDTMGLGIASLAGYSAMGAMQSIPGMPAGASNITSVAGASLKLANVGQLVKTASSLTDSLEGSNGKKKKKKSLF